MADKDKDEDKNNYVEGEEGPPQRPERVDQGTQRSGRRPLPPPRPQRTQTADEEPPSPRGRHVALPQDHSAPDSPRTSTQPLTTEQAPPPQKTGIARLFRRKQIYDGDRGESNTEPETRRRSVSDRQGMRTKASRILYTTDEEVREALMEFAVFIIFLILTSLGE